MHALNRRWHARLALPVLLLCLAVTLAALPAAASAAQDEGEVELSSGVTLLRFDPASAVAVANAGIRFTTIGATEAWVDPQGVPTFAFPITYGALDPETLAGLVVHRGGLRLTLGDRDVRFRTFVIDTERGQLTGRVSGIRGRIPLLDLDLAVASPLVRPGFVVVDGIPATLTAEGAAAFNEALGTGFFTAGLSIGTAQVFGVTG